MIKYMLLLAIVSASSGRPKENNVPWNTVTVPTNCPEGQQLVNGVCRDIWSHDTVLNRPRDVEILQYSNQNGPRNMITVPTNCPPGQELVNGVCRDIWRLRPTSPIPPSIEVSAQREKENAPLNMITVPTNCPPGQQLINGVCRDIWRFGPTSPIPQTLEESNKNTVLEKIVNSITKELLYRRQKRQLDAEQILSMLDETIINKNIITVPNQCPAGYKPDILGICRPIFD